MRFLSPPQASSRAASTSNAANVESSEAMEEAMDSGDDKARDSSDEEAPVLVPKNFRLLEATDVEMEPKGGGKKRGRPKGKGKKGKKASGGEGEAGEGAKEGEKEGELEGGDICEPALDADWELVDIDKFEGNPNVEAFRGHTKLLRNDKATKLGPDSPPFAFFPLFIEEKDVKEWTRFSNIYGHASSMGASYEGGYYKYWKGWTESDIYHALGKLYLGGINPTPREVDVFSKPPKSYMGNVDVINAWGPENCERRWKEFKASFHVCDATAPKTHNKLRKIEPFHSRLRDRCERYVIPCGEGSIDECTQGFQGRDMDTKQHKDKAEGTGWQADCLAFENYIWSWHWRHQSVVQGKYDCGKLVSNLHARCLWLLTRLKKAYPSQDHYTIWCDNLYLSLKFCREAALEGKDWPTCYVNGTCRKGGRGVPLKVMQEENKTKLGTLETKIAVHESGVAVVSVYDAKQVYFMGRHIPKVAKMIARSYDRWDMASLRTVTVERERLTIQTDYNYGMNPVDNADQLANNYRTDHKWVRNRKPWWSQFHWCLRRAMVSAYKVYTIMCHDEGVKKPLTHSEFHQAVVASLLAVGKEATKRKREEEDDNGLKRTRALQKDQDEAAMKATSPASKTSRIRPNSMAAVRSKAASGYFHPISVPNGEARCQWCKFMPKTSENGGDTKSGDQKRPRAQIFCDTCALNFCGPICFTNYHDVDLAKQ